MVIIIQLVEHFVFLSKCFPFFIILRSDATFLHTFIALSSCSMFVTLGFRVLCPLFFY